MRGNYLLPFAWSHYGTKFLFQQNNAAIHVLSSMKGCFEEQEMKVVNHPALNPTLNSIENCWSQFFLSYLCQW